LLALCKPLHCLALVITSNCRDYLFINSNNIAESSKFFACNCVILSSILKVMDQPSQLPSQIKSARPIPDTLPKPKVSSISCRQKATGFTKMATRFTCAATPVILAETPATYQSLVYDVHPAVKCVKSVYREHTIRTIGVHAIATRYAVSQCMQRCIVHT
jgi:hypothetical protein